MEKFGVLDKGFKAGMIYGAGLMYLNAGIGKQS